MIDCLLVGLSRFARRRVIPAIAELDGIGALHVASRSAPDEALAAVPRRGRVFRDYGRAIDEVPPGLVYVSLTNDAHAVWAARALARGHHVVVDKPAFTDLATTERLVALAGARGLVLAEATTYAFHPVVAEVRALFAEHGSAPTHVTAALTPPLPLDNFRYRRALGGGALLDLGPYVASLGRVLWGAAPVELSACVVGRSPDGEVETAFSVLGCYGEGRVLVGHFGFTTEYRNDVHVAGPHLSVEAPGLFSTPPGQVTDLVVRHRDAITVRQVPAAGAVGAFLDAVLAAVAAGDGTAFAEAMLADARVIDRLRRGAGQAP